MFANGFVVVNPSQSPVTINNVGTGMNLVVLNGGGTPAFNGVDPGSLTLTPQTGPFVMQPETAAVFLNPGAPATYTGSMVSP